MQTDAIHGPAVPRYILGFDLRRRPHLETDVLVVGSGIAGLAAALSAAEAGREVLLLTKAAALESNTAYAQGGIAAVLDPDGEDLEQHVIDTLTAGAGLCDEQATRSILSDGSAAIDFLIRHGCRFDVGDDGLPALTREGGHSARRILHANGDATGREVARALTDAVLANDRITVIEQAFTLDLLSDENGAISGVLYQRRNEIFAAIAGATILATGGSGRVFRETTNPSVATGDGLAMAYRAGAQLADLEFMQFHPTTLYIAGGARLLITEAMRGEGAWLVNHTGERFMQRYHEDAELAPRDVVSRAIVEEIRSTDFPHVWLDATHLGADFVTERFPTLHRACNQFGIDISKDWIPVHPSAHYHCGGVVTDVDGVTTLPQLFACGEVGCTGLHGANRLASNSLLEGLVVGIRTGARAAAAGGFAGRLRLNAPKVPPAPAELDRVDLIRTLRSTMWRDVGIERSGTQLATARRSIHFWMHHQAQGYFGDQRGWELQNMLTVGALITAAAERRLASVGTHQRHDSTGEVDPSHLALVRPPDQEQP